MGKTATSSRETSQACRLFKHHHNDNIHAFHHHPRGGVPQPSRLYSPAHRARNSSRLWHQPIRDQEDVLQHEAAPSASPTMGLWSCLDCSLCHNGLCPSPRLLLSPRPGTRSPSTPSSSSSTWSGHLSSSASSALPALPLPPWPCSA